MPECAHKRCSTFTGADGPLRYCHTCGALEDPAGGGEWMRCAAFYRMFSIPDNTEIPSTDEYRKGWEDGLDRAQCELRVRRLFEAENVVEGIPRVPTTWSGEAPLTSDEVTAEAEELAGGPGANALGYWEEVIADLTKMGFRIVRNTNPEPLFTGTALIAKRPTELVEEMDLGSVPTFEEAWAKMEAQGYQYGEDALEQVRFGWEIRDSYK